MTADPRGEPSPSSGVPLAYFDNRRVGNAGGLGARVGVSASIRHEPFHVRTAGGSFTGIFLAGMWCEPPVTLAVTLSIPILHALLCSMTPLRYGPLCATYSSLQERVPGMCG